MINCYGKTGNNGEIDSGNLHKNSNNMNDNNEKTEEELGELSRQSFMFIIRLDSRKAWQEDSKQQLS